MNSNYVHSGLGDFTPGQRTLRNTGKPYMHGPDVKAVQRIVGVTVDGKYGPQTQAAVITFQYRHGLDTTGVVDSDTWEALQQSASALAQVENTIGNYFDVVRSTAKDEIPDSWLTDSDSSGGADSKKHVKKWIWWTAGGVLGAGLLGTLLRRE
jgi:peptidoglycan hydrolase-like protein with peptidoglycan-binding domain